mgnify:CR=1 FL=1
MKIIKLKLLIYKLFIHLINLFLRLLIISIEQEDKGIYWKKVLDEKQIKEAKKNLKQNIFPVNLPKT